MKTTFIHPDGNSHDYAKPDNQELGKGLVEGECMADHTMSGSKLVRFHGRDTEREY